ncbi:MAG: phosphatase PAP2 family protein [Desulfobulbaceae bacterium]|nr:phosphatase PAP2 family protein [Candidatus Kapabacteria bacterium]MBS3999593.1 phosphatase PAP2 family protein [Desulfobulbaceae bacterium]
MIDKIKEPLLQFNLKEILKMSDIYSLSILSVYTLLAIFFSPYIDGSITLIYINILIMAGIVSIATIDEKFKAGRLFTLFRRVYIAPLIFIVYDQIQNYIPMLNPNLYDLTLIAWDKAIFGVNPTEWIYQFAFPALTEFMQTSYMLYFFMPLAHGIELHLKREDKKLGEFSRIILFAFYTSYLLYFIMPAIGPRFFIHDFFAMDLELPGLFLTDFFRNVVNSGGGIPDGVMNPADFVNRDCMPSGHTMVTLVNIYVVFRNKSIFRYPILIFGLSLIVSTIYLRYHYMVDVMAGAVCAVIALYLEPKVRLFVKEKLKFKNA